MKQNLPKNITTKPNRFQRFFWFCSGIDIDLLTGNYAKFPEPLKVEYNKYIGVGTAVFFTAVFASISSTFALSFMENSKLWVCMIFGLIWGINIFFLDRYIVATMRKEDAVWKEIFYALPRILIGLVFAFTISVPIELSLFSGKIQDELSKYNTGRVTSCEKVCNDKIANLNKQIESLDNQIKAKENEQPQGYQELLSQQKNIQTQVNQLSTEISRNEGIINSNRSLNSNYPELSKEKYLYNPTARKYQYSNRIKNGELSNLRNQFGQVNAEIQAKFKKFQEELDKLTIQVEQQKEPLKQEIKRVTVQCPLDIAECQRVAKANVDLLSRYDALGRATGSWFSSIWWASTMIKLLFIFLELAPIISKIIVRKKGGYDIRLDILELDENTSSNKANNEINEELLSIMLQNEINNDKRKSLLEQERRRLNTLLFEAEKEQEIERLRIEGEISKKQKEQELLTILQTQEISQQLEEAKATYNITIDTIHKGEGAEKQLQKKVADYIAEKQFEHLKSEIDKFFDNQRNINE